MPGLSGPAETIVLNALLTGRFISLHAGDPAGTGANEVIGAPYVRQSFVYSLSGNNPTVAANSAVIQFPTATEDWGLITYFGLWSAVSAGTFLGAWPVLAAKFVAEEDTARWDVGKLKIGTDELITL
jgi:hypothetical protein